MGHQQRLQSFMASFYPQAPLEAIWFGTANPCMLHYKTTLDRRSEYNLWQAILRIIPAYSANFQRSNFEAIFYVYYKIAATSSLYCSYRQMVPIRHFVLYSITFNFILPSFLQIDLLRAHVGPLLHLKPSQELVGEFSIVVGTEAHNYRWGVLPF